MDVKSSKIGLSSHLLKGYRNCGRRGRPPLTIEHARQLASSRNGRCLSEVYEKAIAILRWQCSLGHKWKASYHQISQGKWCPKCGLISRADNLRHTLADAQKAAKQKGGVCLEEKYVNSQHSMKWRCKFSHEWLASYARIKHCSWCPVCARRVPLTIKDMQALARGNHGECLSKTVRKSYEKLFWRCSKDHQWAATPNNIQRGQWCPYCGQTKGESLCRKSFETILEAPFPKVRPSWLIGAKGYRLELDGYNHSLKVAFEYQGEQHFIKSNFLNTPKSRYRTRVLNDSIKRDLCRAHGIKLIEIRQNKNLFSSIAPSVIKALHENEIKIPAGLHRRIKTLPGIDNE